MTGTVEQPPRPRDMPAAAPQRVATARLQVVPIAFTQFDGFAAYGVSGGWSTDGAGGQGLAEFAGRACYQSWTKPNPATATNAGYLKHILEVGHLSVLEHGTVTFYITGASRALTHELIRHRHFSYSQLSQRYVPGHDAPVVEPDIIAEDPYLHQVFTDAVAATQRAYAELDHALQRKFAAAGPAPCIGCGNPAGSLPEPVERELPGGERSVLTHRCMPCGVTFAGSDPATQSATQRRKLARQAARSVLPNATETRIVVTGNYRAWRHFIAMRATEHADVEIRAAAIEVLTHLQEIAPNVFCDFVVTRLADGSEVAASPYTWDA